MKTVLMSLLMLCVFVPSAFAMPCDSYEELLVDSQVDLYDALDGSLIARMSITSEYFRDEKGFKAYKATSRKTKKSTGNFYNIGLDASTTVIGVAFVNVRDDNLCAFEIVADGRAISSEGGQTNANNFYVLSQYEDRNGNIEISGTSRRPGSNGIRMVVIDQE